ncbi:THAP domain-containing protein [Phthorimaea operculella]|nr:THAP domain-containing protein [Phthorimaea operculella]
MATVTAYRKCEICGMKSHKNNELKRYFMARFPLDEVRCKLWVKVTGNEDLAYVPIEKLHQLKFVCGKHFEDRDFNKKKTRLKKYAVPSIHLNAKPLADEILAEFPFHVSSFNLGENEPSTSKQVTATSNTSNVQNETDVNNKGVPMTVTSHIVINDTDVNVKESISESTGTGESFHASKIYYNDEIPVIDNTVEITTSDSVIQSSNSSTQQIIPQIDTQAIDAPIRKKKRASDAKSPKIRMKSNNPTLQLTPRKKRLIKRLNKYKMLLKQFRQKVKEVDKIKSPALKTFIKSAVQNQHRRPQGRRWSNDIKGLVLAIYKKSPKVYRYMKQLLPLPSERTLQTILQKVPMEPGGSNCEGDDNELMLDFHDLVFGNSAANDSLDNEHQYSSNFFEEVIDDNEDLLLFHLPEVPPIDNASKGYTYEAFEKQPLVYVSGYIAMAIIKRIKVICKDCSNCLKTNSKGDEDIYKYISLNEWKEGKKSLTYPTVALCSAVEAAVQVFEKEIRQNLYKADIGQYCRLMMLASIDSSWICAIHKNDILERLLQHISLLLIRSECKKINQSMNQKEQACADLLKKAQAQGIAK